MDLLRNILVWTGRKIVALVLIMAILLFLRFGWEPTRSWLSTQAEQARSVYRQQSAFSRARERLELDRGARLVEARHSAAALPSRSEAWLDSRRASIESAMTAARSQRLTQGGLRWAALSGNPDPIYRHFRAGAEIALLERERRFIDSLLSLRSASAERARLLAERRTAARRHNLWNAQVRRLGTRPLAGLRNSVCSLNPTGIGCPNYRALTHARRERASALKAVRDAEGSLRGIGRRAHAARAARAALRDSDVAFVRIDEAVASEVRALDERLRGNWVAWAERPVRETLPDALLILLAAVLAPVALKAFFYFAVAPFAASRPPIRIWPGENGTVEGSGSAVSQRVELGQGHELLVLPEYLQSAPHGDPKSTQWLLDWTKPLSSLAAGMVALTRIRATEGSWVSIASTQDPHSEIGLATLPAGSAMVLHPRALVGLVQPIGQPVRISRKWRLGLSALLTLQFRYLVFHGPGTLVLQGKRGLRREPAGSGRGINQASTVGFSAGLDYSVRRSETFWAYLMGKQGLYIDSFAGPAGSYLYQVMPREGQRSGIWGRGPNGLADAALKVFGV